MRRLLLPLLLFGLTACGSLTVDADGVPGFNPSSQTWQLLTTAGSNHHSFVLSNKSGYCDKQKKAMGETISANDRQAQRVADGEPVCDSLDLWYDDLADANAALEGDGASFFRVTLARAGETSIDGITAPSAGEYRQVGAGEDKFIAQYTRFNGKLSRSRADAFNCLGPEDIDETNFNEFNAEVAPGLLDVWSLDAGLLDLASSGDDAWDVDVSGDLLSGSSTIGSLEASFTGSRCEVPANEETLNGQ